MRGQCAEHGLATADDGRCVLCRRAESRTRDGRIRPSALILTGMVGAAGLVALSGWWLPVVHSSAESSGASWSASPAKDSSSAPPAKDSVTPASKSGALAEDVKLASDHPLSHAGEAQRRGGEPSMTPYSPTGETAALYVPPDYVNDGTYGVIVWISAGPNGSVPLPDWHAVLTRRRLIWIGAHRSGNDREVAHRVALALDGLHLVEQRFAVHPRRTYIAGVSGGAKSALRTLMLYPDVFEGGLLSAGADYFREIPATSVAGQRRWPAQYARPLYLSTVVRRPVALVAGDRDVNLGHMSDVLAAMKEDGMQAMLFRLPGLGHQAPPGADLARALAWVEGSAGPEE